MRYKKCRAHLKENEERIKAKSVVRRTKIYKGESPVEEIQQAFKEELREILKNTALRMGCSVEELKCRVDNLGRVEVQKMAPEEMAKRQDERARQKRRTAILERKKRG